MRLDYATYAKRGFFLGIILLAVGFIGEWLGTEVIGPIPMWEQSVLFYMMVFGIVIGFCSVFGFGIFLPLTE